MGWDEGIMRGLGGVDGGGHLVLGEGLEGGGWGWGGAGKER